MRRTQPAHLTVAASRWLASCVAAIALVSALLVLPGLGRAQQATTGTDEPAPPCAGNNMLAPLETERPKAYNGIRAAADRIVNGRALLWRVEQDGGDPSWLFGTMHSTDERLSVLAPEVVAAFEAASKVIGEIVIPVDPRQRMRDQVALAKQMVAEEGERATDLLSPEMVEAVQNELLAAGYPPLYVQALFAIKPWASALSLSLPYCETEAQLRGELFLDERLQQMAHDADKPVIGLETDAEQLATLAALDQRAQVAWFVMLGLNAKTIEDQLETLTQLWLARRMDLMLSWQEWLAGEMMERSVPAELQIEDLSQQIEFHLLEKRNIRFVERLGEHLDAGGAFFAVGAGHLLGDSGLVELLRRDGYSLTPVW